MIEGISAADPVYGEPIDGGRPTQDLGKDAFLQLLVSQMRNQNPLEPTSNDQFIAQLAQFSSLEEMQTVNENLVGLAVLQQSNALMAQLTDSSVLIGKHVQYDDPTSGESRVGSVGSVRLEEGMAILRIDGQDVPLANVTEVTGDSSTGSTTSADGPSDDAN